MTKSQFNRCFPYEQAVVDRNTTSEGIDWVRKLRDKDKSVVLDRVLLTRNPKSLDNERGYDRWAIVGEGAVIKKHMQSGLTTVEAIWSDDIQSFVYPSSFMYCEMDHIVRTLLVDKPLWTYLSGSFFMGGNLQKDRDPLAPLNPEYAADLFIHSPLFMGDSREFPVGLTLRSHAPLWVSTTYGVHDPNRNIILWDKTLEYPKFTNLDCNSDVVQVYKQIRNNLRHAKKENAINVLVDRCERWGYPNTIVGDVLRHAALFITH